MTGQPHSDDFTLPVVLTDEKLDEVAKLIAQHKGWSLGDLDHPLLQPLVKETILMTVRAMEMAGLRIVSQ